MLAAPTLAAEGLTPIAADEKNPGGPAVIEGIISRTAPRGQSDLELDADTTEEVTVTECSLHEQSDEKRWVLWIRGDIKGIAFEFRAFGPERLSVRAWAALATGEECSLEFLCGTITSDGETITLSSDIVGQIEMSHSPDGLRFGVPCDIELIVMHREHVTNIASAIFPLAAIAAQLRASIRDAQSRGLEFAPQRRNPSGNRETVYPSDWDGHPESL